MTLRPNNTSSNTILITVDLEDWFQVENLRPCFPHEKWDSCELRIESNTHKLLDLFDQHNIRATFFVLGWIAEKCPDLVKSIHHQGHEIASHGYIHTLCSDLSPSVLREGIYHSKALLEDISGQPISGYRAPSFSLTADLIDILGELGFTYDSSYNSFGLNKRYGRANGLFVLSNNNQLTANNGIIEIPMSNLHIAGKTIPWSGGGYFRFWPSTVFHRGVKHILKNDGYYMFYCHPWEVDDGQPRISEIGVLSRFRHYLNLDKTLSRLDRFFTSFKGNSFLSCNDYLKL